MSYNTVPQAKAIVGLDLPQELLDEAKAIIDGYTPYRWTETTLTDVKFSGYDMKDSPHLMLSSPIRSVDSLVVDGATLVEDTGYKIRSTEGIVEVLTGISQDADNVTITYKYGWVSDDVYYTETISLVRGAEARIALYLKRNPLFLSQLGTSGVIAGFSGVIQEHMRRFLYRVPKPFGEFQAV